MIPLRKGNDAGLRPLLLLLGGIALAAFALCTPVRAEGPQLGPRIEAHGDSFELLGIVKGNTISFYLDDFKTNAPVHKAKFDIDTGDKARKLTLRESEPGLYWDQQDWLAKPGSTDLVITVKAGNTTDLLGGTLKIPAPPAELATLWGQWRFPAMFAFGFIAGVALLVLLRMLLRPRRPSLLAMGARPAQEPRPAASTGAAAAASAVVLGLGLTISGSAFAMPAGPGHSHGPDDVTTDVAPDNQPPDSPRRLADGSLFVPKPAQRVLAIRTTMTNVSVMPTTTRVFGRIIADPTASGRIQAGIQGRIDPGDNGLFIVGQRVERGQIVCSIVPIINPIDNANIQQQLSQIDGEMRQITDTLQRAASGEGPALAPRDLQTMQLDLMSLRQRRAGISLVINDREALRIPLRSPATGIIAISNVLAGQIVEARDVLFEVIDPERIWVEAAAFDMDVVNNIEGATAVTDNGFTYDLTYIGRAPRRSQQAIPLNFRIKNPDANLTVGSPANVFIRGRTNQKGIRLPLQAITQTPSGQSIVFEHVSAEHYVPVMVRSEPLDGDSAVILAGLAAGQRVVVEGATLLGQVR